MEGKSQFLESHTYTISGLGTIRYVDLPRGHIKIINDFPKKYLVKKTFPLIGTKYIHKAMVDPLMNVMGIILEFVQYDSTWEYIIHGSLYNPRHMWYHRNKPLSRHAFAAAIDINPWENPPGARGTIPMHIVEMFEKCGFDWGGRWKRNRRDDMHFEIRV